MRPAVSLLALGLLIAATSYAAAAPASMRDASQAAGTAAGTAARANLSFAPGTVVTRPIVVTYEGPGPAAYFVSALLPERWRLLSGRQLVTFQRAGAELVLVSFVIPKDAQASDYQVVVTLSAEAVVAIQLAVPVTVLPELKLRCALVEQPDYILAGTAYKAVFVCANDGNVPLEATVRAASGSGFEFRAESSILSLRPGESTRLSVIVSTPLELLTQVRHVLRLDLRAVGAESVKASASSVVDIIPRTMGSEARYRSIRGLASLSGVFQHGETDAYGLSAGLGAQGFLDDQGATAVDLRIKAPLVGAGTLVPDEEELYASVRGPGYSAAMGTQFFSLSPLTESSRYGVGVAASKAFGPLELRAFSMDNLLDGRSESLSGAKASYRFSDRGVAALNLLDARGASGVAGSASAEGHFLTPAGLRLEWEYAASMERRVDDALQASLGGKTGAFSYSFKYLRAGPRFRGPQEDVSYVMGTFAYSPSASVRLRGVIASKEYHLLEPVPDRLDSSQLGVSWTASPGTQLSIDALQSAESLRSGEQPADIAREGLRLGVYRNMRGFDVRFNYEFWTRLTYGDSFRTVSERLTAGLGFETDALGEVGAALGIVFDDHDGSKAPYTDLSLNWNKELSGRAAVSASYRTVDSALSYYQGSDSLELKLGIRLPSQAELAIAAAYAPPRSAATDERDDFKVTVDVSSPFRVPVSVRKNIGIIEGAVRDAETGKPLPDVVLRLGGAVAATDPFGRYRFHSLYPGAHRLYLDPASLPPGLVPAEPLPVELSVGTDTVTKDIGVTRAAAVSGRILLYRFDRNFQRAEPGALSAFIDPQGVPGVLLTLRGPEGVKRALTEEDGGFRFPALRPGTWSLEVPMRAFPDGAFTERGSYEFALQPGEAETVTVKVFPKIRQIRFIDQGTITEDASVTEDASATEDALTGGEEDETP